MNIFKRLFKGLFKSEEQRIEEKLENVLLDDAFQDYRKIKLRTRAESTIKTYEITLRHLNRYLGRFAKLSDLNDETIAGFLGARIHKCAIRTVNRDLVNLQAISNWLADRNTIPKRLTDLEPFIAAKLEPKAMTREEVNRLWASIKAEQHSVGRVSGPVFWSALFSVFWDTGERFSAVTGIRLCDIDFKTGRVLCVSENRKGQRAERSYSLHKETLGYIQELIEQRGYFKENTKVFYTPFAKSRLWQELGRIMTNAGMPNDPKHKFHLIRRTAATHIQKAGGDASAQLGHASPKVTQENYIDPSICQPEQASTILFRPGQADEGSSSEADRAS